MIANERLYLPSTFTNFSAGLEILDLMISLITDSIVVYQTQNGVTRHSKYRIFQATVTERYHLMPNIQNSGQQPEVVIT